MPSRSWMAALTLAAALVVSAPIRVFAAAEPVVNQVKLELQIAGVSRDGCEVEIKPGHAGCQFPTIVKKVGPHSTSSVTRTVVNLEPILAQSTNADRDCAFAITLREPGRPPRTFHRGMRLSPRKGDHAVPVQRLTCYLSTPSLLARETEKQRPRR